MKKTLLLVDDEPINLQLLGNALKDDYDLKFARNGDIAVKAARDLQVDLILLDIKMPGKDGYSVCSDLKNDPLTESIPIIFVTGLGAESDEAKGFDLGAVDYLHKPISPQLVRKRVALHLSLVRAQDLEQSQKAAIFMLGTAGHFNDTNTGVHIWRMAEYAEILAREAGWSGDSLRNMALAAAMHDTGKLGVPESILKAPRRLTPMERTVIETHTVIGWAILLKGQTALFDLAATIARSHHERWDGQGYPDKLQGDEIPEAARIVAIADVFDALTMKRPYKEPWSEDKAIAHLRQHAGTHFDPRLVELFIGALPKVLETKKIWDAKETSQDFDTKERAELQDIIISNRKLSQQPSWTI